MDAQRQRRVPARRRQGRLAPSGAQDEAEYERSRGTKHDHDAAAHTLTGRRAWCCGSVPVCRECRRIGRRRLVPSLDARHRRVSPGCPVAACPTALAAVVTVVATLLVPFTIAGPLEPWLGLLERIYVAIPGAWQVVVTLRALGLDAQHGDGPGDPADGPADRVSCPRQRACAVGASTAHPGRVRAAP